MKTLTTKEALVEQLNLLITLKFGNVPGAKAKAFRATALRSQPYFYNMTTGSAAPTEGVLEALRRLPDYVPPPRTVTIDPRIIALRSTAAAGDYVVTLDQVTADLLAWFNKRLGESTTISDQHISKMFPYALRALINTWPDHAAALRDWDALEAKRKNRNSVDEISAFD